MPRGRGTGSGVAVVTTAETVAATLSGVSAPSGDNVDIEGYVDITTGTGTTLVQVKIERGAAAGGAQVGPTVAANVTAGNRIVLPINVTDVLGGDVAGQSYVITIQQANATANGTINSAFIGALW